MENLENKNKEKKIIIGNKEIIDGIENFDECKLLKHIIKKSFKTKLYKIQNNIITETKPQESIILKHIMNAINDTTDILKLLFDEYYYNDVLTFLKYILVPEFYFDEIFEKPTILISRDDINNGNIIWLSKNLRNKNFSKNNLYDVSIYIYNNGKFKIYVYNYDNLILSNKDIENKDEQNSINERINDFNMIIRNNFYKLKTSNEITHINNIFRLLTEISNEINIKNDNILKSIKFYQDLANDNLSFYNLVNDPLKFILNKAETNDNIAKNIIYGILSKSDNANFFEIAKINENFAEIKKEYYNFQNEITRQNMTLIDLCINSNCLKNFLELFNYLSNESNKFEKFLNDDTDNRLDSVIQYYFSPNNIENINLLYNKYQIYKKINDLSIITNSLEQIIKQIIDNNITVFNKNLNSEFNKINQSTLIL